MYVVMGLTVLTKMKRFWRKLNRPSKGDNNASAYSTLPYYYPTEQVTNRVKPLKKRKRRR
jgi:hypothetical protein